MPVPNIRKREEVAEVIFSTLRGIYGQDDLTKEFSISPTTVQSIERKVQESNAFLNKTTFRLKATNDGQIITGKPKKRITKRTAKGRRPENPMGLSDRKYHCEVTEKDALIEWKFLDDWAGHTDDDIYKLYRECVMQGMANDALKIGWWGQIATATTDDDLEYCEDQLPGWYGYLMAVAPEKVMGIEPVAGGYKIKPIKIDVEAPDADFRTLSEAVYWLRMEKLHPLRRERQDVRSVLGSELVVREAKRMYGTSINALEQNQLAILMQNQVFGETPHDKSDHFPMRGIFISPPENLARYALRDSYRRKIGEDDHNLKGIVDYNYNEEWYGIEDVDAAAAYHPDSIYLKDPVTGEWGSASYRRETTDLLKWNIMGAEIMPIAPVVPPADPAGA